MNKVLILDFGSQYTQLITRKVRELGVYSEISPFDFSPSRIKKENPSAIILSSRAFIPNIESDCQRG